MLSHYVGTLFRYAPCRVTQSLTMMVFSGLTQGVGVVMLIPLLGLIGLNGAGEPSGLTRKIGRIFEWFRLDLTLVTVLCLYVGIVAVYAGITQYQSVLNTEIVQRFTKAIQDRLYRALCRAQWRCLIGTKSSQITQALTSDAQRVGFATQQLLQLSGIFIVACVHVWVALMISIPMTLFALACVSVFLLLLHPLNRRAHSAGETLRDGMTKLYGEVSEHLGAMKLARSHGLDSIHEENFRVITKGVADQMVLFSRINSTPRMIYEIGAAVVLAGFFYVAVEIFQIAPESLLIIVFLFARLLPKFSSIQQCAQRITNALPSFQALLDMERTFMENSEPAASYPAKNLVLENYIRLSNVCFRYTKSIGAWAVKDVSIVLPARKITAFVGHSGAGKSTLADLILGLFAPESGEIFIDGQPLKGARIHPWRQSIGYVPQETFLFNDTIRANLLWAMPRATEKELWDALELAAARDFVSRQPKGMDTPVGERGTRLSGGERQQIALARALLRRPTFLLLDEATSSVDSEGERRIQKAVNKLRGELTMLIIAHRSATIRMADSVITLSAGEVAGAEPSQAGSAKAKRCPPSYV